MDNIIFRATTRGGRDFVEVTDTGTDFDRYKIKEDGSVDYADDFNGILADLIHKSGWKEGTYNKIEIDEEGIGQQYLDILKQINKKYGSLEKSEKGSDTRQFYFQIIRFIAQKLKQGVSIEEIFNKVDDVLKSKGITSSRKLIKSENSAAECFGISEEEGEDVEELRSTFENDADFRAALEDYFDIYNDYAVMSEDDFNKGFKKFIGSSVIKSSVDEKIAALNDMNSDFEVVEYVKNILDENGMSDKYSQFAKETDNADTPEELGKVAEKYIRMAIKSSKDIESSKIGDIKNELCLGQINDKQAMIELELAGKSESEAEKMVEKWKQNGILKSSVDKAVKKAAEYFGTESAGDTISCQDIITYEDEQRILEIADEEKVQVQIGQFSVRFYENPEQNIVKSSLIDKYIQKSAKLVKDVNEEEEMSKEENERRTDEVEKLGLELMDKKDDSLIYDEDSGKYTINGDDVKNYIIDLLGDNYFDDNRCWDYLFDSILPELRDYATNEKVVRSCYEIYEKRGSMLKLISNTFDKEEALTFKNHGFLVKANKEIFSNLGAGTETVIEIQKNGRWELVSLDNTPEGWSTDKQAKIFPSEEKARSSSLLKRLADAGYSEENGNLRISQYND